MRTPILAIVLSMVPAVAGAQSVSDGSSCPTDAGGRTNGGSNPFEFVSDLFHFFDRDDGASSTPKAESVAPVACKADKSDRSRMFSQPSLSAQQGDELRADVRKGKDGDEADRIAAAEANLLLTSKGVREPGEPAYFSVPPLPLGLGHGVPIARVPILGTRDDDAAAAQDRLDRVEKRLAAARTPQDRADDFVSLTKAQEELQRAIAETDPDVSRAFLLSHGVCAPTIALPSSDDFSSNRSALQDLLPGADRASTSALATLAREANPTWAADHPSGTPGSEMIARTRTAILRGKRFPEIRHDEDLAYRNTPGVGQHHRAEIAHLTNAALASEHRGRPGKTIRARAEAAAMAAWKRGEDDAAIRNAAREAWPRVTTDRRRIYMQQPTEWQCAPTSLTMAEAAWGVAPSNAHTLARLTNELHDSPDYGLPGNASLVADQARRDGLQAVYNPSTEASAVRAALKQGRTVVLNGSLGIGGHFIYIAGLRKDGSFIVDDPFRPDVTRFSDADLNHFTHDGPNPPGFAEIWR